MYHKSARGPQSEPTPSQGVNAIKTISPTPPKPLTQNVIERLRESTRIANAEQSKNAR
jgi:hypothetical protein